MSSATYRGAAYAAVAIAALAGGAGCQTFTKSKGTASADCAPGECQVPGAFDDHAGSHAANGRIVRPPIRGAGGSACENGNCPHGGCPNCKPPKRWSDEWYAMRAAEPVSARQVEHAGKQWPPYPRPCGEKPEFSHIYHAAHYWPYPYVCEDRAYVRTVLAMQEHNGWTEACTLYDYHFDTETQEVNQPGRLHLRWIMQNPRPEYRVIHVQTADNSALTEARLAATRLAAEEMAGGTEVPPVLTRVTDPLGRPAHEIRAIQEAVRENMIPPRIDYNSLPTGAGGGGT